MMYSPPLGPAPFDVERVMRWTVGSVCLIGVAVAALIKIGLVAQLCKPDQPPAPRRLVAATLAEGGLLIAALYLLQIPVETDASTIVLLLAFFFTGAILANWLALRKLPSAGSRRRLRYVLLLTMIYPVVQTAVAFTLGPILGRWFVHLFP
jgi:hypothetical protein